MIKRYKVTINDEVYRISVEAVRGGWEEEEPRNLPPTKGTRPTRPDSRPAKSEAPKPEAAPAKKEVKSAAPKSAPKAPETAQSGADGRQITAPLPGNMWKVKTANGQSVKKGDVLFIIEAMKMENEIFAPCDGIVSAVSVAEGAAVSTGQLLCVIQ